MPHFTESPIRSPSGKEGWKFVTSSPDLSLTLHVWKKSLAEARKGAMAIENAVNKVLEDDALASMLHPTKPVVVSSEEEEEEEAPEEEEEG